MTTTIIEEQISSKYLIKEKLGRGLNANFFLVTEKEGNMIYVAKVFKEEDEDDGEQKQSLYDKEIEILKILKPYNNPYIVNIIDSGESKIIRKKKDIIKAKYYILEYAAYGRLFDFIYYNQKGLGELYSKVIFSKIMEGIIFLHAHDICHRNLKLENILLDDEFCPKITNFEFACLNKPNLTQYLGTYKYIPPEIHSQRAYDGKKADIFSLGAALIILVTGLLGFNKATKDDMYYKKIKERDIEKYWEILNRNRLSPEFKDLYIKMVSYEPNSRPTAEEVLKHPWFNEIREMNLEQRENLDKEIKEELHRLSIVVKEKSQKEMRTVDRIIDQPIYRTRCFEDKDEYFLNHNIKPKIIDTPMNVNNSIKINGYINPIRFMNFLCDKLIKKFGTESCYIETSKKKLELYITFEEEEEKEEEEETNEEKEDNEQNNELIIQIKLYENNDEFILRFSLKKGDRKNFLDKFNIISGLVKNIIS